MALAETLQSAARQPHQDLQRITRFQPQTLSTVASMPPCRCFNHVRRCLQDSMTASKSRFRTTHEKPGFTKFGSLAELTTLTWSKRDFPRSWRLVQPQRSSATEKD